MSVETAEVERLKWRKIEVEDVGKITFVRDTPHAKSNHFIEQSRPYFPNAKLPTYFDSQCCNFLTFAKLFCFASFFGALTAAGVSLLIPIFFFIGCLALFLVYCQHERVNQKSLPTVTTQPVIASQNSTNSFYEVTVTDLDGIALQNYQAGVGFITVSQGKVKFQAFNTKAIAYMMSARCQSRLMMILFLACSVYNCYFVVAYSQYGLNAH